MKFKNPSVGNGNDKYKCIAPEAVIRDNKYAFSFNPTDQYNLHGAVVRFRLFRDYVNNILLKALPSSIGEYDLWIELSKKGRLHLHGTLIIHDIFRFYSHSIIVLQNNGCYEIDTINDIDKWNEYCWKCWHIFNDNVPRLNPHVTNIGVKGSFDNDEILQDKMRNRKGVSITKYLISPVDENEECS